MQKVKRKFYFLQEKPIKCRFFTNLWNIITKIINKINDKNTEKIKVKKIIYFFKGCDILNFVLKK